MDQPGPDGAASPQASCEGLRPETLDCQDEQIVATAVQQLHGLAEAYSSSSQPFFYAAGLHKPHLPFYADPSDFAMYRGVDERPPNPKVPEGMPYVAWHSCLSNAPGGNGSNWGNFTDIPNRMTFETPMGNETAARLRRGYMASVTYTDRSVGRILDAIEAVRNDTVVVLLGDHGWSLLEQNIACKMTNTENGVRIPLIIAAPGVQVGEGKRVRELAEAVDLYRTLADLTGVGEEQVQPSVDGVSLGPMVRQATAPALHDAAMSQFPRCYSHVPGLPNTTRAGDAEAAASRPLGFPLPALDRTDCQNIDRTLFDYMGYSIRTKEWRYTEWRRWKGQELVADWEAPPHAVELYDHRQDEQAEPFGTETRNDAGYKAVAKEQAQLAAILRGKFCPR